MCNINTRNLSVWFYWIWCDDVIKWQHFLRYYDFVRGIHRSPVNSPHKGQWRGRRFHVFYLLLNKRLSKQSWGWWSQTSSRPWRHFNDTQPFGIDLEYVIFQHLISLRNGSDDCKMFFFYHKGFWINCGLVTPDGGRYLGQHWLSLYLNQCWLIINEVQWHSY